MRKKKDPKGTELQKKAMIEALTSQRGIVTLASKSVGMPRSTHYLWMNEDPEYKQAVVDIDNVSIDYAESMLFKRMQEGSDAAIIFYLKCRGKKRGYVQTAELDVNVNQVPPLFPDDEG